LPTESAHPRCHSFLNEYSHADHSNSHHGSFLSRPDMTRFPIKGVARVPFLPPTRALGDLEKSILVGGAVDVGVGLNTVSPHRTSVLRIYFAITRHSGLVAEGIVSEVPLTTFPSRCHR